MKITEAQLQEILEVARPLMDWLKENTHPHCKVIVDSEFAELVEGIAGVLRERKEAGDD